VTEKPSRYWIKVKNSRYSQLEGREQLFERTCTRIAPSASKFAEQQSVVACQIKRSEEVEFMATSSMGGWSKRGSIGYGTFPEPYKWVDLPGYVDNVKEALRHGYRHIDTAQEYENEAFVGEAIRRSGLPRSAVFLTSKLSPSNNSYQGALDGIAASKKALQTSPDMYLVHFPGEGNAIDAWRGLIEAKRKGLCEYIGVSNFEERHLLELIRKTGQTPTVNQIEFHPHLWSDDLSRLVALCERNSIVVEGYSPFAQGTTHLLTNPTILEIGKSKGVSPARVILRWCMHHNVHPIIGSRAPAHMADNLAPYDFALSQAEVGRIDALGKLQRRVSIGWGWDPTTAELR
jgi:diketogulonate reductase-like aldo/keto reductase